jgi:hypothetical protein
MGIGLIIWLALMIVATIKVVKPLRKDWKESKRKIDYEEEIRNFKN